MWFLILVVCLLAAAYLFLSKRFNYWESMGVPSDRPSLFSSSMLDLVFTNANASLMYSKLYGKNKKYPYIGTYKFLEPAIIAIDLDLIKNVFVRDFSNFTNNGFELKMEDEPIFGSNPFVQVDDAWKKTRSVWTSSLTANRIKGLYKDISTNGDLMVEHLKNHIKEKPGEALDTKILFMQFFSTVISNSVFRLKTNSFADPESPALKMVTHVFEMTIKNMALTVLWVLAPWITRIFNISIMSDVSLKAVKQLSKDIIKDRRENGFQKTNPLDSIMTYNDKTNVTEFEMAGHCFNFLFDGTETSSSVASFMLYSLAANIDVQNKLRSEIDEAFKSSDGELTYDKIHDLPYLDMVLSESLRLCPPLIATQRISKNDYTLPPVQPNGKPVVIKKGTPVLIPIYGIQRDPEYFPNPEKFDPERFNEENKGSIPKYSIVAFGEGPRICLGMKFAVNQIKIGIVALIRNFELRVAPKMSQSKMEIDPNSFVMKFKDGLWVTIHERS